MTSANALVQLLDTARHPTGSGETVEQGGPGDESSGGAGHWRNDLLGCVTPATEAQAHPALDQVTTRPMEGQSPVLKKRPYPER